ncbi:MAG: heavy metal translocating P-type ATPase metal-binding domain-containing protein [Bacteroidota bacterium]|nr:heavy metal translocating P-type ATPase metal-binding domain-containing protein [Bacteroidota bacterium]
MSETLESIDTICYHCGEQCDGSIHLEEKDFCCEGCKQVFLLLNENNLCNYYNLEQNPGIKIKGKFISERFAYLDDETIINKLIQFKSDKQVNVVFQLPQIHCSSCIFLLENLHRIEKGVIRSQTDFQRKEIFVSYDPKTISLRKLVELLAFVGYEPPISLRDDSEQKQKSGIFNRKRIYEIGIAGFCFANIMMLSFPEYLSSGNIETLGLKETFTWLIFALSLPVLLYCAPVFIISAYKGLRQGFLNIDAPIALATLVTFSRSYYEIITHTGAGYLDSGTGIVFLMLVGRWFQDKTYDSFSFDHDYKSFFPLGVTIIQNGKEKNIPITQLIKGNRIIIRNEEMIPADAVLIKGEAHIDYSFVSGESTPVSKHKSELLFAGGKQMGSPIEMEMVSEVSRSYITQLWNNNKLDEQQWRKNTRKSFIHPWSRYFTLILFSIAIVTAMYWWWFNPANILPTLTSVLIVACPCSLLLSATFTYGNMMRILGKNKLYLKNANVIETMTKIDNIIFDKTGTITQSNAATVEYDGKPLASWQIAMIKTLVKHSAHPLSKILSNYITNEVSNNITVTHFKEKPGKGLEGIINGVRVKIGAPYFLCDNYPENLKSENGSTVYISFNGIIVGKYHINNYYRDGMTHAIAALKEAKYPLHVLSGDNETEKENLQKMFGTDAAIYFHQSPVDKLNYIKKLQQEHKNVLMVGDGLNDAGALLKSDLGIAVSDNAARFTPACDAIIDGEQVTQIAQFLRYCQQGKNIVTASFVLSILYNIVGLSFAVSANLSPMVAAILMPASSISIVLLVTLASNWHARKLSVQKIN